MSAEKYATTRQVTFWAGIVMMLAALACMLFGVRLTGLGLMLLGVYNLWLSVHGLLWIDGLLDRRRGGKH